MGDRREILKVLGPGFLFAAVSVGVSHLVQSTRAGADFGLTLLPVALVVLVLKYPLFEFGQRYAVATGRSLLEGYRRQGKWSLVLYLLLTLGTMFTVLAAVAFVTAGMAMELFGLGGLPQPWSSATLWSAVVIAIAGGVLVIGRFPLLDKAIKVIMALLTVSTVAATIAILPKLAGMSLWGKVDLDGIIWTAAFVGWMPTGLEVTVWQSFWTLARRRETGYTPTLRQTLLDFRIGYIGTGVLAVMFILLGTVLMFGSGEKFEGGPHQFAARIIQLYTQSLGDWSWPIIALAAFTTMFSTLLTVLDGFPRSLWLVARRFRTEETEDEFQIRAGSSPIYWAVMAAMTAGALVIVAFLMSNLKALVDLATILSFVAAPFLGLLAYRAVVSPFVPAEYRPGPGLRILALLGIVFLSGFLLLYLYLQFLA